MNHDTNTFISAPTLTWDPTRDTITLRTACGAAYGGGAFVTGGAK